MKIDYKKIIKKIQRGKRNAIHPYKLALLFNISEHSIRLAIEKARKNGELIASDTIKGGYYYIETEQEAKDYLNMEFNRAKNVYKNIINLYKNIKNKYSNIQLKLNF